MSVAAVDELGVLMATFSVLSACRAEPAAKDVAHRTPLAAKKPSATTPAPAATSTAAATSTDSVSSTAAAADEEDMGTHHKVIALLQSSGARFSTLRHEPTRTSEESAKVRGVPLASGAKAMLLKSGKPLPHGSPFVLCVMSAVKSIDWSKIRKQLESPKLSMASLDDVRLLTGCVPGAVPPFGSLFNGVRTFVDASIVSQGPFINFNAGLRTHSVINLPVEDYLRIESPVVAEFT